MFSVGHHTTGLQERYDDVACCSSTIFPWILVLRLYPVVHE